MNDVGVSDHAIIRFLERTGDLSKKIKSIKDIVIKGKEIEPKRKIMKLLNNECKESKYYTNYNMVAVVESGRIVTVYRYNEKEWVKV